MSTPTDLIPLKEAQELLKVSDKKMTSLITKEKALAVYIHPLDRRKKLVSRAEVLKLNEPQPQKSAA